MVEGTSYERDGSAANKWEPITTHYVLCAASWFAGKVIEKGRGDSIKSICCTYKQYKYYIYIILLLNFMITQRIVNEELL